MSWFHAHSTTTTLKQLVRVNPCEHLLKGSISPCQHETYREAGWLSTPWLHNSDFNPQATDNTQNMHNPQHPNRLSVLLNMRWCQRLACTHAIVRKDIKFLSSLSLGASLHFVKEHNAVKEHRCSGGSTIRLTKDLSLGWSLTIGDSDSDLARHLHLPCKLRDGEVRAGPNPGPTR